MFERVADPMKFWSKETLRRSRKWRSYVRVVLGAYVLTLSLGTLLIPYRANDAKACARSAVHSADEASHCEERADGDVGFAHAVMDRPVVLGVFLTPTHNGAQASLTTKAGFSFVGDAPTPFLNELQGALVPIPALADAASGLGFSTGCRTTTASSAACRSCSPSTARSSRVWRWRRCVSPRARRAMDITNNKCYDLMAFGA